MPALLDPAISESHTHWAWFSPEVAPCSSWPKLRLLRGSVYSLLPLCGYSLWLSLSQSLWQGNAGSPEVELFCSRSVVQSETINPHLKWGPIKPLAVWQMLQWFPSPTLPCWEGVTFGEKPYAVFGDYSVHGLFSLLSLLVWSVIPPWIANCLGFAFSPEGLASSVITQFSRLAGASAAPCQEKTEDGGGLALLGEFIQGTDSMCAEVARDKCHGGRFCPWSMGWVPSMQTFQFFRLLH